MCSFLLSSLGSGGGDSGSAAGSVQSIDSLEGNLSILLVNSNKSLNDLSSGVHVSLDRVVRPAEL